MKTDLYIKNISQLVTCRHDKVPVIGKNLNNLEIIIDGAVACADDKIIAIGSGSEVESKVELKPDTVVIDASDKVVTPGLVDPHTHPVFAKTREDEFEMRNMGKSYMEIAAAGGGIRNSSRVLRETSEEKLYTQAINYMDLFLQYGTTTIEAKSGYGLTTEDEIKQLEVIRRLNDNHVLDLIPTFLGAHEIPDEYRDNKDDYVNLLIEEMIPRITESKLAVFSDIFCEKGVFELEDSEKIQTAAKQAGLELKFHADEIVNLGGAELAARLGAVSADHLVYISDKGIQAMAETGTIAVFLPGTSFYLDLKNYAPARKMIETGVPIALSTDFNPGSSATVSLQMIMTLAGNKLKMTTNEIINAVTINSACALLQNDRIGSLEVGKNADMVVWNLINYKQIPYFYGVNQVYKTVKNGKIVWENHGT